MIVFGILIALAADAWWDNRVERADERVALRQLLADFEENAAQLEHTRARHRTGQEAASVLIQVAQRTVSLDTDSLRRLVRELDLSHTFTPRLAALQSIVAEGRLGIISSDSLRLELAGFPGLVEDLEEEEVFQVNYAAGRQYDYFSRVVNWNDIWGPVALRSDRSLDHLSGDEELESIAAYRWSLYDNILSEGQPVEAALQRILSLLRKAVQADGG